MTDQIPALPKLYFASAGKFTYARTYKNVWKPKKSGDGMVAIKTNIKKVGRIDSTSGIGVINFDNSFYSLFPDFKNYNVIRCRSADNKFFIEIKPKSEAELPEPVYIKSYSIGAVLVLNKLLERDPLLESLKELFPDSWQLILSFAYFMVMEPDAKAERLSIFAQEVALPYKDEIYPSKLTRLLQSLTNSKIEEFFRIYLRKLTTGKILSGKRFWAIDSTSISTYAKLAEASYGKNKQDEELPQLNVMFVTDEDSGRPLYFQHFNGSIPDMAACVEIFEMLLNLGVHSFVAVADRGFFSETNMAALIDKGYHFVMCVPFERCSSYQSYIYEAQAAMAADNLYSLRCDQEVYTSPKQEDVGGGHKAHVHVFFNKHAASDQAIAYQKRLKAVEKDYFSQKTLTAENVQFMLNNFEHDEQGNFKEQGKGKLALNKREYQRNINNCGVFLAVSDSVKRAEIAYEAYASRQAIEQNFRALKDRMQIKRLRVSTEESLDGKCFIEFLAVTLNTFIDKIITRVKQKEGANRLPHHSVMGILDELRGIRETYFSETKEYVVSPISKKQRDCLALFGVKPPVSHYEEGLATANQVTVAPKPHGEGLKK